MSDPVAAAIATVSKPPADPRWQGTVRLPSSGREIRLNVPADITPIEVIELVGFVSTQLPSAIIQAARKPSRILVPQ